MAIENDARTGTDLDRTVLLGVATPLSTLGWPVEATGAVIAIVVARLGILMADLSSGAVVRGSGSNRLWISGSPAQVETALGTLAYVGATAGMDDLSICALAPTGALMPVVRSTITVVPSATTALAAHRSVRYESGTLTLESRILHGVDVALQEPDGSRNSTTCVLVNSTIGADSNVFVRNENHSGGIVPRIAIAGRVVLQGTMAFAGAASAVSLAQGGSLVNEGSISIDAEAVRFAGAGTLVNDGLIGMCGHGTGAPTRIDTRLDGSGVLSLGTAASVEIGATVGAGAVIRFGAGSNILHLSQPASFGGQIAGFHRGDLLVLDGVGVTSTLVDRGSETDDVVVTLINGTSAVGNIRFDAPEGTSFQVGTDAEGHATVALAPAVDAVDTSSVDVFRFFDAAHGTQLLTQDRAERNAIIVSRPDLHYEGVGLHAYDPAQTDLGTTAVYRFFDLNNGTHLLTASATERDTLLATRPDLAFEPSSTIFEHSTAEAGDTAVFRFFDNHSGAHFFTADAGERAAILSTRPDMTQEGIAFYAPTA